jgi:hypothetical protein
MGGRPALRIGQRGKIKRIYLGGGVWLAPCRYRDTDGVTFNGSAAQTNSTSRESSPRMR